VSDFSRVGGTMMVIQQASARPAIDEEFREKLRNDPRVVHYRRSATDPFVPRIRLTAPVDGLWLIGRRDDDEVEPYLRGIDE
jgi:hypothetical protein